MLMDVMIEDRRWRALGLEALAEKAARATLVHLGLDPKAFEISLLACNDARIAALNEDFRGKPQPTNVLSWPSEERGAARPGEVPEPPEPGVDAELGDIAIAYETCAREAEAGGKPLADHAAHLIVHAVLHLLGYDHVRDQDATLMEACEVAILGKLGIPDPY
ncbi:rRNA maturation RNase YbeY [Roseovarius aquimarinus]|uniref:Endoribonuclease YbeY n=1 Tax=Roseovarius aquimarinus TaxID=1229156 RepID=A0ABW7I2R9_9RHOB